MEGVTTKKMDSNKVGKKNQLVHENSINGLTSTITTAWLVDPDASLVEKRVVVKEIELCYRFLA